MSAVDAPPQGRGYRVQCPDHFDPHCRKSLDEAIDFINLHSSHHTDAIITKNFDNARRFLREVDSSSVMVNASTRFADGFEYGLGAEIGISPDKVHVRVRSVLKASPRSSTSCSATARTRRDRPFLNTRLTIHGQPFLLRRLPLRA